MIARQFRTRLMLGIFALFWLSGAHAALGSIEWMNRQCSLMIIKGDIGYVLAQHVAGGMLSVGDMLVGDLAGDSRPQTVKNATTQTNVDLWLQQSGPSVDALLERVPVHCKEK